MRFGMKTSAWLQKMRILTSSPTQALPPSPLLSHFEILSPVEGACPTCLKWSENCSVMSDSFELYSPWNSSGQNTEVGILSLLQGIFPTQGSNPGLPHCRQFFTSWATREAPSCLRRLSIPCLIPHNNFIWGSCLIKWHSSSWKICFKVPCCHQVPTRLDLIMFKGGKYIGWFRRKWLKEVQGLLIVRT